MNRQYQELLGNFGADLKNGRTGVLCNQTAFDFTEGKYLLQVLSNHTKKLTVFIPEHGFFAEQPDQAIIDDPTIYEILGPSVEYISLYRDAENRLGDLADHLARLNTLIIDIQDVGVRYYTYVTTIGVILQTIKEEKLEVNIILVDKPNPAGRQVEGTRLPDDFSSFIGLVGIPNRYGLTIGELCNYLGTSYGLNDRLNIIKHDGRSLQINPSPNIPSAVTCSVFSGQCLIEGTNLSEGRGTTRPFEIFGAPFLKKLKIDWVTEFNTDHPEALLRPLEFIPFTHKYSGELCYGFQLHPKGHFHSLWYTLQMLKSLSLHSEDFKWLDGPYEAWSEKAAIELLVGDTELLSYLKGDLKNDTGKQKVLERIRAGEKEWIELTREFVLYSEPLYSLLWDLEP